MFYTKLENWVVSFPTELMCVQDLASWGGGHQFLFFDELLESFLVSIICIVSPGNVKVISPFFHLMSFS